MDGLRSKMKMKMNEGPVEEEMKAQGNHPD